jgi:EAL domain-containing protein (putative c-di-GMP-specific phosphodiesterase class I)
VVRAAVRLAHDLGIECIAEGIETKAQAEFLMASG